MAAQRNVELIKKQASYVGSGQNLPDATPPLGKIHPFSKTAINVEPIMKIFLAENINESSFDREGVVVDKDSAGNLIIRDYGIRKKNCQQAKIL